MDRKLIIDSEKLKTEVGNITLFSKSTFPVMRGNFGATIRQLQFILCHS